MVSLHVFDPIVDEPRKINLRKRLFARRLALEVYEDASPEIASFGPTLRIVRQSIASTRSPPLFVPPDAHTPNRQQATGIPAHEAHDGMGSGM